MRRKKLAFAVIILAVLVPTVVAEIILSNYLFATFTVSNMPVTLSWVGDSPNNKVMYPGNSYQYAIGIENPTSTAYPNAYVILTVNLPSSLASFTITQLTPVVNQPSPYLSGTTQSFTMNIPIPANFDGTLDFSISFDEDTAVGDYSFTVRAYSS